jgi:cyclohexanone monooxygenase
LTPAPIPASTLAPTSTAAVTAVTATTTTATTAGGDTSGADFDVVVIGAGVTGIYAVHKFRNELGLSTCAFEAAEDIGGVWYVNRYAGARCDCESYMYAYSFSKELEQSWRWRSKFPSQAELLEYLNHVVERFDLRRSFRFGTRVTSATYDPAQNLWEITTDRGTRTRARYLVTGVGCLSEAKHIPIPGAERFSGTIYHTSAWPHHEVDFTGRRVGVVGTGASGVQAITEIAKQAAHLTVFQRTANFATPLGNEPLDDEADREIKRRYREFRELGAQHVIGLPYTRTQPSALDVSDEERLRIYEERYREGGFRLADESFTDLLVSEEANRTVSDFVRSKIRGRVTDPAKADILAPKSYRYGTRRTPLESSYYETYNRDNVTLVDVSAAPLQEITANGLRTTEREYELDDIVFALGFEAMTGALVRLGIVGRGGVPLAEKWKDTTRTYLGLMTHGYPNLFMVTGPQSPSILHNMPPAIEAHVNLIADILRFMRGNGFTAVEPTPEAEDGWVAHVESIAAATLYSKTRSVYMGSFLPGRTKDQCQVYMGGGPAYRQHCEQVIANGFEGFDFSTPMSSSATSMRSGA